MNKVLNTYTLWPTICARRNKKADDNPIGETVSSLKADCFTGRAINRDFLAFEAIARVGEKQENLSAMTLVSCLLPRPPLMATFERKRGTTGGISRQLSPPVNK
ncbi:hypothetical protein HDE_06528 [Halotydeus destructor]|nr:hypothetical protein HDE_06528 [Halotydeus destructor]